MKHVLFFVVLTLLLNLGATEEVVFQKDVVYGTTKAKEENNVKVDGVELKLDLARPATGDGPFPCVLCIHGGGWATGSKSGYDTMIKDFAKKGYVAATIEYRFAPMYKFPAQIEDVKCAVRYLRAHAKELHINTEKFGAMGESAGGHLSLMLGLMNKEDGCEGEAGCSDQSSKVQCVVNYFGPGDFLGTTELNPTGRFIVANFLGTADVKNPIVAKASPATYIDKNDAPVLTFHGSVDPLVPLKMSEHLHELLKKAGVEEKLEIQKDLGHGWRGKEMDRTMKETVEFFDKHLKN
ncbi:MAG: alpha/beta hydrolase [Planctomycetota bacterium]